MAKKDSAATLLSACRKSLAEGLETQDPMEAEWSKEDRKLIARIDKWMGSTYNGRVTRDGP